MNLFAEVPWTSRTVQRLQNVRRPETLATQGYTIIRQESRWRGRPFYPYKASHNDA